MNIFERDISVNSNRPILFSHVIDYPIPSSHSLHLHDYIEIYIYISGDVDFIVQENYIPLHKNDIIITKENVLHKPIVKSSTKYERFYIGFPSDTLDFIDRGKKPLSFLNTANTLLSVSPNEFKAILILLNKISNLLQENDNVDFYLIFSYFLQFLNYLNSSSESNNDNNIITRTNDIPTLIKEVLTYIENSETAIGSVKELSKTFHVNSSYLSTLFSESTHVNLKQYLTTKKIAAAKSLLLEDRPISDIAYECGFSSCSHFISVFKQFTGKTPREYRSESK